MLFNVWEINENRYLAFSTLATALGFYHEAYGDSSFFQ